MHKCAFVGNWLQLDVTHVNGVHLFQDVDPTEVAFYAWITTKQTDLPVGHTIKYDGVGNNYGNGYDPNTGVFTCPTTGLYHFNIYVHPTNDALAAVSLRKDGVGYTHAIAEPSFTGQDIVGGSARPFRLDKGDRVWVEVIEQETSLWSSYTTFSGHLINR